jgi:selenocysteine lyase/cysteine desulfurase
MGPREVGLLYVRADRVDGIWPNVVSIPWYPQIDDVPAGARKFDALGQRDDAAIAALVDTVAIHEALTPAGVESKSADIAGQLRAGLLDLGVEFVSNNSPTFTSNVVILKAPRDRAPALVEQIFTEAGVQTAATGGLRMSPHLYNTREHVDRVIAAVARNRAMLA